MTNRYNQLLILEEVKDNNRLKYKVQCDCGKIELKRKDYVTSGRSKSCKSCASKKTAKNFPPPINRKGCYNLSGTHFSSIKHGALRRNISFNLTPEFLWELFINQKGLCAITGIPIILTTDLKNQNVNWDIITASLDRIDNTIGYEPNNVWWVHKEVNRFKNNYSMEDLLYWCKLILNKHDNSDPSINLKD
jgi:hypothetical protein